MNQRSNPARNLAYDHIGNGVSDKGLAMSFHQPLGVVETASLPSFEANEMLSPDGVRINLIFNGARLPDAHNALLDAPVKLPGITHPAFIVDDLQALEAWLGEQGIVVTEGPHPIGPRRVALFIRDPHGNVLEFNQIVQGAKQ